MTLNLSKETDPGVTCAHFRRFMSWVLPGSAAGKDERGLHIADPNRTVAAVRSIDGGGREQQLQVDRGSWDVGRANRPQLVGTPSQQCQNAPHASKRTLFTGDRPARFSGFDISCAIELAEFAAATMPSLTWRIATRVRISPQWRVPTSSRTHITFPHVLQCLL